MGKKIIAVLFVAAAVAGSGWALFRRFRKSIFVAAFFLLMTAVGWFIVGPELSHALNGCHPVSAQEPEEGNPDHREPTKKCNHRPKADEVGCKCCPSENNEDKRCKSWCFKSWCTCGPCV